MKREWHCICILLALFCSSHSGAQSIKNLELVFHAEQFELIQSKCGCTQIITDEPGFFYRDNTDSPALPYKKICLMVQGNAEFIDLEYEAKKRIAMEGVTICPNAAVKEFPAIQPFPSINKKFFDHKGE